MKLPYRWRLLQRIRDLEAEMEHAASIHRAHSSQLAMERECTKRTLVRLGEVEEARNDALEKAEVAMMVLESFKHYEPAKADALGQRIIEVPEAVTEMGRGHEVYWRFFGAAMLREGMAMQRQGDKLVDFYFTHNGNVCTRVVAENVSRVAQPVVMRNG